MFFKRNLDYVEQIISILLLSPTKIKHLFEIDNKLITIIVV